MIPIELNLLGLRKSLHGWEHGHNKGRFAGNELSSHVVHTFLSLISSFRIGVCCDVFILTD
jgi:hypothetical protein